MLFIGILKTRLRRRRFPGVLRQQLRPIPRTPVDPRPLRVGRLGRFCSGCFHIRRWDRRHSSSGAQTTAQFKLNHYRKIVRSLGFKGRKGGVSRYLKLLIVVTVLVFMAGTAVGQTADPRGSDTFDDVPVGHWADEAVGWAVAGGITKGVGEGRFGLDGIVTRAQIMTFLYRTAATLIGVPSGLLTEPRYLSLVTAATGGRSL